MSTFKLHKKINKTIRHNYKAFKCYRQGTYNTWKYKVALKNIPMT